MTSPDAFTIAIVTSFDPVAVSLQEFDLGPDAGPDNVFDDVHAPKAREYPFDLNEADHALDGLGYERTAGWRWAGTGWGAVVQPMTGYIGRDEDLAGRDARPWEQGGYEG
jgi:hypothetical protein